ncbi:hypothetical protein F5I97DRAFT_1910981 [Phlebopus sp. FC_14]|nr:hypothetical protein F5I97DRAFT_1910981 [Phlebopus sp. FC_14]
MPSLHDIEELLRKLLLGQELVNTQFHLFSRRSKATRKVVGRRVLYTNDALLTANVQFFADLLSSSDADLTQSDPSLSNIAENDDDDRIPSGIAIEEYGYESDSDLEDDADPDEGSASAESDAAESVDNEESGVSIETTATIRDAAATPALPVRTTRSSVNRLQVIGAHRILVKDTAFQTWYALLNYLHTGKVVFLAPKPSCSHFPSQTTSSSTAEAPKCSAKSMYRLACKVGIDALRDLAFASICNSLTERNILAELASTFTSRYPPILEKELDVLFKHVGSPSIVTGLPLLVQRIANKELVHGADIINGLHTRILSAHYPHALRVGTFSPSLSAFSKPAAAPAAQSIVPFWATTGQAAATSIFGSGAAASTSGNQSRSALARAAQLSCGELETPGLSDVPVASGLVEFGLSAGPGHRTNSKEMNKTRRA